MGIIFFWWFTLLQLVPRLDTQSHLYNFGQFFKLFVHCVSTSVCIWQQGSEPDAAEASGRAACLNGVLIHQSTGGKCKYFLFSLYLFLLIFFPTCPDFQAGLSVCVILVMSVSVDFMLLSIARSSSSLHFQTFSFCLTFAVVIGLPSGRCGNWCTLLLLTNTRVLMDNVVLHKYFW